MRKPWIGVDLDGTLAYYDGYKGPYHIGPPIQLMVDRVKLWISEGKKVKIFTARAQNKHQITPITAWCIRHLGFPLEITNTKDPEMIELWDDRCIQVEKNTGRILYENTGTSIR